VTTSQGTTPTDPDEIRREIERTQDTLSADVDALTEKVTPSRIVERRVERARGTAARWKDKVMGSDSRYPGGTRDAARGVAESVSGTASSAASTVSDAAAGAASAVGDAPQLARQQTQGNPLAAGLIAFGAGWLISSLLPASRREQELAERATDTASEVGRPVAEAAKQTAAQVQDDLAEPAQQAVDSVRSRATDAGRTVAEEGRTAADQVQGQAQDSADTVRDNTTR
jgi:cell division septum initiation protein DivIVA